MSINPNKNQKSEESTNIMCTRSKAKTIKVHHRSFRWHRHHQKILRFQCPQRSPSQTLAWVLHPFSSRKENHRFRRAHIYLKQKKRALNIPPNSCPQPSNLGQWSTQILKIRKQTFSSETVQAIWRNNFLPSLRNPLKNCFQNTNRSLPNSTKTRYHRLLRLKLVNLAATSKTVKCFWTN